MGVLNGPVVERSRLIQTDPSIGLGGEGEGHDGPSFGLKFKEGLR